MAHQSWEKKKHGEKTWKQTWLDWHNNPQQHIHHHYIKKKHVVETAQTVVYNFMHLLFHYLHYPVSLSSSWSRMTKIDMLSRAKPKLQEQSWLQMKAQLLRSPQRSSVSDIDFTLILLQSLRRMFRRSELNTS